MTGDERVRELRRAERAWQRLRVATDGFRDRRITAMMRVRNEVEFLEPAVRSIAPLVDEIVIVDNASSDGSAGVIAALARRFRKRIVTHRYGHTIGRVGAETWTLAENGQRSPRLSSRFYNWCLARCAGPYVLKWDGDMVALDPLARALAAWRRSERQVLVMHGINVHADRRHAIAARSADREALLRRLAVPGLPRWATSLTFDYPEPRLFPKLLARYTTRIRWTQELASPFLASPLRARAVQTIDAPAYLHLKFCKRDPVATYTPDLARVIVENVAVGPRLSRAQAATLRRWGLGPATRGRNA
jgi:glycosyltransferase involved in cell wall biosynthesis